MFAQNEHVRMPLLAQAGVQLHIKRLDLAHAPIYGNKYFKLKYNIEEALAKGFDTLITFGGAFSNHIFATAAAGKKFGLKTIGIIRGDELQANWMQNPTLSKAAKFGMEFKFVSRTTYRQKKDPDFLEGLIRELGPAYILPEGGTNSLAIKGCEEILSKEDKLYDIICCSVGTGGTLAGLANSIGPNQSVLGFSALKGNFLKEDICKFTAIKNWDLSGEYHFGGYAKVNEKLVDFINQFMRETGIVLDPIYTGKLLFGIMDLVENQYFKRGTSILSIHSGGVQGIDGMNELLKKKNLPLIAI